MMLKEGWSRWSPDNPDATHPLPVYNAQNAANKTSSRYLEDASFIRLRNIMLGYRFDEKLISKLNIKGLDVYLSGDNLWTMTGYSGIDPETALYPAVVEEGNANAPYPSPKRFLLGLNVSF